MDVAPEVEILLQQERVARLATVDGRGRPHIVPVVFAYDGQCVFTPVDAKPKAVEPHQLQRVRNILANPDVQVLIDRYQEDWEKLWYVQLRGRARLIEAGNRYVAGVALLEHKYAQYHELPLKGRPVIEIEVVRIVTWGRLPEPYDDS